jgi:hypothetical protein
LATNPKEKILASGTGFALSWSEDSGELAISDMAMQQGMPGTPQKEQYICRY